MQNPTILRQWPYIWYVASREPMHIACHDYFHNYPYGVYLSDLLTWAESPHLTSRLLQTERSDCKEAEPIMCSCSLARLRNLENGNVAQFFQGGWPIFHRLYMSRRILRMQIKNAAIWELWVERAKERKVHKKIAATVGGDFWWQTRVGLAKQTENPSSTHSA